MQPMRQTLAELRDFYNKKKLALRSNRVDPSLDVIIREINDAMALVARLETLRAEGRALLDDDHASLPASRTARLEVYAEIADIKRRLSDMGFGAYISRSLFDTNMEASDA